MEKLSGDPHGIEELKSIATDRRDYLKFLLTEARTATDRTVVFKGKDGLAYRLRLDPASGTLEVAKAP